MKELGKPARLIPTSESKELRATSALLAVATIVRPFSKVLFSPFGASKAEKAIVEAVTEPTFVGSKGQKARPDGMIKITRGKTDEFVALVEVKTGKNHLEAKQINEYLSVARSNGFDCLITISNEIAPAPGVHPTEGVSVRSNSRVQLHHLSWTRVLAMAVTEKSQHRVEDPEQAWILDELICFLQHSDSGAMDFEDMGPNWKDVRDGARHGGLKKRDEAVIDIAQRWDQLLAYVALKLGGETGEDVQEVISQKERLDPTLRAKRIVDELTEDGLLTGELKVPNAAGNISVAVDLRSAQISIATSLAAPSNKKGKGSVSWLLRQLKDTSGRLAIESYGKGSRSSISALIEDVREDATVLLRDGKGDVSKFEIISRSDMGKNRKDRSHKLGFSNSLLEAVRGFYIEVLQDLRQYQLKPSPIKREDQIVENTKEGSFEAPENSKWSDW
jgi:hypothetical protein